VPSLAERRDDVGRLLVHFLERELGGLEPLLQAADTARERPWPPAPLVARLAAHDWPGNVRELANVARRLAIALEAGQGVDSGISDWLLEDADAAVTGAGSGPGEGSEEEPRSAGPARASGSPTGRWRPVFRRPEEVGEDELLAALRAADFRLAPTAEALGVSRTVLYKLIDDCPRVRKASDLRRAEIEQALAEQGDEAAAARALEVSLHGLRLRMHFLGMR
jgi:DNA-binding NtrC family response regulator